MPHFADSSRTSRRVREVPNKRHYAMQQICSYSIISPATAAAVHDCLRPIRQHENFRRRKVPDLHECRAASVLHRNLLSNRMGAGVSVSDSSLRGVRDHSQEWWDPAKRISSSGWRVQIHIHHHITASRFVAMAIYDAQSLLVIQNSRPRNKLTSRRQGEREPKIRDRSLILPPVA